MSELKYLSGYPAQVTGMVERLIAEQRLGAWLLKKYPVAHAIKTDKGLYDFTIELKNQYLRKSPPLSRVIFDNKINLTHQALGLHSFVSRVQGGKLKTKNEIRIGAVFKTAPLEFLRMIVVHELAHIKEKEHAKPFYNLCLHMEPDYPQLELDVRLYLSHLDLFGHIYQ